MPHPTTSVAAADKPGTALDRRCGNCGYSLAGLPADGKCPECGEPYDATTLVLFGYAVGSKANAANARQGQANFILYLLTFVMSIGVTAFVWSRTNHWFLPLLVIEGVVGFRVALYLRHRLLHDEHEPAQLRLARGGFAQRNGVGPVRLRPWGRRLNVTFGSSWSGRYVLRIQRKLFLGLTNEEVAIDFACPPEAAEVLREQIYRWSAIPASSPTNPAETSPQR